MHPASLPFKQNENKMLHETNKEDLNEPFHEKTGLRGFRPSQTQPGCTGHRRWLEAWNFGFRKNVQLYYLFSETKMLIRLAVTTRLICVFAFAYAKSWFSHDTAQIFFVYWYRCNSIFTENILPFNKWDLSCVEIQYLCISFYIVKDLKCRVPVWNGP